MIMTISQIANPLQDQTKRVVRLASEYVTRLLHFVDRIYFADEYESLHLKPPRPIAIHRALKKRSDRKIILKK